MPENWHETSNTPALHRLVAPDGAARLSCFGGGLDWSRKGEPPYSIYQSYSVSHDNVKTWSVPNELPATLTGDRHVAKFAPDGRLVVAFRDLLNRGRRPRQV